MKSSSKTLLMLAAAAALLLEIPPVPMLSGGLLTSEAVARIGRPATPRSYAGVARRTTRRTIRRGAFYAALPRGCVQTTIHGYAVWKCGGTYYQASGGGYVVVYF